MEPNEGSNGVSRIASIVNKESGETVCEVFGPPRADSADADGLSQGLYALSEILVRSETVESFGMGMAGPYGYGVDYENDVFKMHPYCWCERDTCLWCAKRCGCKLRHCGYYLDGREVSKREQDAWHATIVKPIPWEAPGQSFDTRGTSAYKKAERAFDAYVKERDARSGRIFRALIHTCQHKMFYSQPEDIWAVYAPQPYPESAPHFWHKASGLRAWWYKSIGRDMQTNRPDLKGEEWARIYRECLDSLPDGAVEKARAEHEYENTPEYKAEESRVMHAMFEAMSAMHDAQRPCYKCSMDEKAFMVGGQTETCGGLKIVTVTLDKNGACPNCEHVTTEAEHALLAKRRKKMGKKMRARWKR